MIGLNESNSYFCAIVKDADSGEYFSYFTDDAFKTNNKFIQIGESNIYAVRNTYKDDNNSEGKFILDNPFHFTFRRETGHNGYYNFFDTYEFIKDYPSNSEYEKNQNGEWYGTGFAIADGYILTNFHVTNGANQIKIRGIKGNKERSYKGMVIANDKIHDLSIIKITDKDFDGFGDIPYQIGKATVDVGDNIFVLGYPDIETMGEEIKLTEGIISASSGYKGSESMYQISAAVQSGNSGAPLFKDDGVIIGVVCAKHSEAENAGYAVKISYLYSLINKEDLRIKPSGNGIKSEKLSKMVRKVKDFVYVIECSGK